MSDEEEARLRKEVLAAEIENKRLQNLELTQSRAAVRRRCGQIAVGLFLACAAACGVPPKEPSSPSPPPAPAATHPLPSPEELEGAPDCVRRLASLRQCHADARAQQLPHYSCPVESTGWNEKDGDGRFRPWDLNRDWNAPIHCGLSVSQYGDSQREALTAQHVAIASGFGKVVFGTIELSRAYCIAELDFVERLECDMPPPVLQ